MTTTTTPQDQGQMVTVSYAADEEYLYRRTEDARARTTITERVSWDWLGEYATSGAGEFEPWNGRLAVVIEDSDWKKF